MFSVFLRERWRKVQGVYMALRKVGWGVGCNRREVREEAGLAGANSFTCFHRCLVVTPRGTPRTASYEFGSYF